MRPILYIVLFLLILLHNDIWFWNDARLVSGIPIGLLYHIAFCVAAALLMVLLVNFAWPKLEVKEKGTNES